VILILTFRFFPGIAGLSCCLELFRICERERIDVEVVLVEGQNRLGGRMRTDYTTFRKSDGTSFPVDLGASWIHGITLNPLATIAKEAGAEFVTTSEDVKMFQSGMEEVDAEKDERAGQLFDELLDYAVRNQFTQVIYESARSLFCFMFCFRRTTVGARLMECVVHAVASLLSDGTHQY
jgi:monoamine oxidase